MANRNGKLRYNLYIKCLTAARDREEIQERDVLQFWNVQIKILEEKKKDGKRWTNVAQHHPNFNNSICNPCKYSLEHLLLRESKTLK